MALDDKASDPHCRFMYAHGTRSPYNQKLYAKENSSIHARHSLDPLRISLEMLCLLFSYLQVMPSFLDFIFPFGDQEYAQDFYFSGLREESVLYSRERGPAIQQLGRSGREIRLCYNLRSVEVSPKQKDFPWSIRQAAIYHHFDIETGKSAWITVKGNKVIQDRLSKLAGSWNGTEVSSISGAFAASLRAHLLLCDWSAEKWRWYINDLENGLQSLTRSALYTVVDRPPSPIFQSTSLTSAPMSPQSPTGTFSFASRRETINSLMSPRQRSGIPPSVPFGPAMTLSSLTQPPVASSEKGNGPGAWARMVSQVRTGAKSSLVSAFKGKAATMSWIICNKSGGDSTSASEKTQSTRTAQYERREPPPNEPPQLRQNGDNDSQEKFRFSDLQSMQYIEEKVQEALLVLRLNAEVLQDLREHYKYVVTHSECPSEIAIGCATEIMRFEKSVRNVEKDLRLQQSRTETLLHLLTERKTFVSSASLLLSPISKLKHVKLYGILQYQSMQASENFAKKAQVSAEKMEAMTVEMHSIAQKTKQETVSMRIITLVTLFFLPGTFIGVGHPL